MLNLLQRKRTAKGFGVHSPFAFSFIRKVITEKSPYYAYFDLKAHLSALGIATKEISEFNRLSFRIVNFFGAKNVLEIGSGNGVNTLFVTAPSEEISCCCIETNAEKLAIAHKLLEIRNNRIQFPDVIPQRTYDVVFADAVFGETNPEWTMEKLFEHSCNETCWVVRNIHKNKAAKAFWKSIKQDSRVRVTFDLQNCGIVILNSSYHKLNYIL